ncbi:cytoplasm protein [Wallemia mellicola]|nr:cytoplasm protein [Wallemia mellicola]TIC11980.1 cytoplasm protein [Wallemia mellicola]TIC55849.1 cytoplasm protein [Wallemia mellicola]
MSVCFLSESAYEVINPAGSIYMGKDKFENEELIKYADETDIWFHVDKYSSAHLYLKLPENSVWDSLPQPLLSDIGQLTKANSIHANKLDNVIIIYTPVTNLKKTGDLDTGTVCFHNDRLVRRVHISAKDNAIVNRLNKTKVEKQVDFVQQSIDKQRELGQQKKKIAISRKQAEQEAKEQHKRDKEARSYTNMWTEEDYNQPGPEGSDMEDDFIASTRAAKLLQPVYTPSTLTRLNNFRQLSTESRKLIDQAVNAHPIVLFMKGKPSAPLCGFSRAVVQILDVQGADPEKIRAYDCLEDDELRNGIKEYSDWPTIPQVYVNGEFVGGCDILLSKWRIVTATQGQKLIVRIC